MSVNKINWIPVVLSIIIVVFSLSGYKFSFDEKTINYFLIGFVPIVLYVVFKYIPVSLNYKMYKGKVVSIDADFRNGRYGSSGIIGSIGLQLGNSNHLSCIKTKKISSSILNLVITKKDTEKVIDFCYNNGIIIGKEYEILADLDNSLGAIKFFDHDLDKKIRG